MIDTSTLNGLYFFLGENKCQKKKLIPEEERDTDFFLATLSIVPLIV